MAMANWWKQFAAWVTGSGSQQRPKNNGTNGPKTKRSRFLQSLSELGASFRPDIFTAARFKIVSLYLLMGIVVLGVAGYLVYTHVLGFVDSLLGLFAAMLQNKVSVASPSSAALITQTLNQEIGRMNLGIGLWLILTLVISAYVLAGITLGPVKRAMEKQKRFMGNVAHELRTPLSVMKANAEVMLLEPDKLSREELVEALRNNLEEIDQMAKITQFLFDTSTFENRLSKFELSPVNLNSVAERAIALVGTAAREKGVALAFTPGDDPVIRGNPIALHEMAVNLIKNAVAYTPAGGSVILGVRKRAGKVMLSVQDTGIGIPQKDLPHIFEAFYRSDTAPKRDRSVNAGLGLAIVKEIADIHRASIHVRSEVNRGTIFIVRFPAMNRGRV